MEGRVRGGASPTLLPSARRQRYMYKHARGAPKQARMCSMLLTGTRVLLHRHVCAPTQAHIIHCGDQQNCDTPKEQLLAGQHAQRVAVSWPCTRTKRPAAATAAAPLARGPGRARLPAAAAAAAAGPPASSSRQSAPLGTRPAGTAAGHLRPCPPLPSSCPWLGRALSGRAWSPAEACLPHTHTHTGRTHSGPGDPGGLSARPTPAHAGAAWPGGSRE